MSVVFLRNTRACLQVFKKDRCGSVRVFFFYQAVSFDGIIYKQEVTVQIGTGRSKITIQRDSFQQATTYKRLNEDISVPRCELIPTLTKPQLRAFLKYAEDW